MGNDGSKVSRGSALAGGSGSAVSLGSPSPQVLRTDPGYTSERLQFAFYLWRKWNGILAYFCTRFAYFFANLIAAAVKVVLRGARRTGKTSLVQRLQGKAFSATEYKPSPEISTSYINNWTYKNSDDKIRVEVWDVVDTVLADELNVGTVDDDDAPAGV